jgi:branched-chain amino acid transport system permease protein
MISLELIIASVIHGILLGGVYTTVAIGLTLIFGVLKFINFAHGEFVMLSMYLSFWLTFLFGINPFIIIPIAFLIFFSLAFPFKKLAVDPVFSRKTPLGIDMSAILITYGISLILKGGAHLAWTGNYRVVKTSYSNLALNFLGTSITILYLLAFIFSMIAPIGLFIFLKNTRFGKGIRAITQDPELAMCLGIDVEKLRALALGLSLGLAGISGVIFSTIFYIFPDIGSLIVFKAFVITVLGGLGNVVGALCGSFILGVIESISSLILPYAFKDLISFLVFLFILLVKPKGLFGK